MVVTKFSHAKKLITILLFLIVNSAVAADDTKTIYDLDALQEQTVFYKALAVRNKAREESGDTHSFSTGINTPVTTPDQKVSAKNSIPLPSIVSVMGNAKGLIVKLEYSDGSTTSNKIGDVINGNFKLSKVNINEVEVISLTDGTKYMLKEGGN